MSAAQPRSRHHGKEEEHREDHQVHDALQHRGAAGAERDHAEEQREGEQELVLGAEPELKRGLKDDRDDRDRRDRQPDRCQRGAQREVFAARSSMLLAGLLNGAIVAFPNKRD